MANTTYNKIIYGNRTLIDLTSDTATAATVLAGQTFHDKSGAVVTGACDYDANTSDDTATSAEILMTKTAHARGLKITGTMPNRGSVTGTINTLNGQFSIPQGYHDGSGKVSIDATEASKIIGSNIREGITILGVEGTMSGTEEVSSQTKTITPSLASQVITPDAGYNYLSQVTVQAIPYSETDNSAGGITVTIAA